MKFVVSLFFTGLVLMVPVASRAEHDPQQLGPYIGLGGSGGFSDFSHGERGFGDSAGFNLVGGYRWHEYFALEGLYEYMDDFGRTQRLALGLPRLQAALRTHNFSLLGKLILPLPGPLQPYVKGGVGFLNVDEERHLHGVRQELRGGRSGTEVAGRLDGGVDLQVTPQWSLNADAGYVMPTESLLPFSYFSASLGVRYRF
jgi:opacity protein-like surface antigen